VTTEPTIFRLCKKKKAKVSEWSQEDAGLQIDESEEDQDAKN
jgi:hypothetical protein